MNSDLAHALVRATDTQQMYLTNAEFKATIDALAQFVIPDLIRGTASRCAETQAGREAYLQQLMKGTT